MVSLGLSLLTQDVFFEMILMTALPSLVMGFVLFSGIESYVIQWVKQTRKTPSGVDLENNNTPQNYIQMS